VDEIRPAILEHSRHKRQHLTHYTLEEQTQLISHARALLEDAGSGAVSVFRAGNLAVNGDTFKALRANRIVVDSSLGVSAPESGADLRLHDLIEPFSVESVATYPVSAFRDGAGRLRRAQVGACSAAEMRDALWSARAKGWKQFIVLSHNFELLKAGSSMPDHIVVNRFEALCSLLAEHRDTFPTVRFEELDPPAAERQGLHWPRASLSAGMRRYAEQAFRRLT
jgi:hypothetical protein